MKPSLFIASSSESLGIAYALQENLERVAEVTVWDQGVFELSRYTLDSLVEALDRADFGAFVFAPDDVVSIRGQDKQAVRDNVLFELGMFIGRLRRERNFVLLPKGLEEGFRLPTDLLGLTPALYEPNRQDGNLCAALGPASSKMIKVIESLGQLVPAPARPEAQSSVEDELPSYTEADKKAILESWMGSRPASENVKVIHFVEVDKQLRLPAGATKSFIKAVAGRWGYVVQHEGEFTILFAAPPRVVRSPIRASRSWVGY